MNKETKPSSRLERLITPFEKGVRKLPTVNSSKEPGRSQQHRGEKIISVIFTARPLCPHNAKGGNAVATHVYKLKKLTKKLKRKLKGNKTKFNKTFIRPPYKSLFKPKR